MTWNGDQFETETWRYIKAANFGARRTGPVRGEVIHTPETSEMPDTAIGVARFFASGQTIGSTHTVVDGGRDGDNVIQCVYDSYVAHGAAGANHDRLHVEIAGRAGQTAAQWRDDYSMHAIEFAANVTAQHALKYDFPIRQLTVDQLRRGVKGICDHDAVSKAFGKSTHWDVGPHFPWDAYLAACQRWHTHWLSTHPGFNPAPDEPDFRVVVIGDGDLDQGMGRVYGKYNALKYLEWPFTDVTFGSAVLVGGVAHQFANEIEAMAMTGKIHVLAGDTRDDTAAKVAADLARGFQSAPLDY